MTREPDDRLENLPADALREKLRRLEENLHDLEDHHAFTFGKTSVHIGAEKTQTMQQEFEEERAAYIERIAVVEELLRLRMHMHATKQRSITAGPHVHCQFFKLILQML